MTTELKRTLTAKHVAIVTVGTIIGSGIFLTPGNVLRAAKGSVGVALSIWAIGGVLTLLGALAYAELGCMRTSAGGLYAYIRDAFGPIAAFVYGWTLFVVIATGSIATLAVAAGDNMAALVPGISPFAKRIVALVMLAYLAIINVRGTRKSTAWLGVATVLKVAALAFLIIVLPIVGTGFSEVRQAMPASFDAPLLTGALAGMISVLWAYEGWQYATFIGGEVIEPQRNFPLGLLIGTVVVILVYVLANVGYVAGLGPDRLVGSSTVASDAVGVAFGPLAAKLMAIPVLVSIVSGGHGILLTASRVFHTMAHDGVFFRALGDVDPKYGTPAKSIIAMTVWAGVLAMSGTFNILLTYVVFVGWIFYGLGGLCVIAFRRKDPAAPRPFKVPGYPVTPIVFVLASAVIVLNTVITTPVRGAIGIGGALLGVPIYYYWKKEAPKPA
jgi:APA family basic amino acid/polyamine antiporter